MKRIRSGTPGRAIRRRRPHAAPTERGTSVNTLTRDQLTQLAADRDDLRISIFMPTRPFSPGSQEEDTTRLKNLLRTVEEQLVARGMRQPEIDTLLKPARALLDDRPFWLRSRAGLALLIGPDGVQSFRTADTIAEQVFVNSRYHLRPLLTSLGENWTYWLLALSQKSVRLFSGSADEICEVPIEGLPTSLADAMRWEDYERSSLQFHTQTGGTGGRRPAVFHGTGEADPKDEILRYFRDIDRGLHEHLKGDTSPLVVAGVDYLLPLYREVNTYPYLAEGAVSGNPDSLDKLTLHAQSRAVAERVHEASRMQLADRIGELWASPKTRTDAESILAAAHTNRIDSLLVALDANWWGAFDPELGTTTLHETRAEGDEDLIDLAITQALLSGAEVLALDPSAMPHEAKAVAVLRY